MQPRGPRTKRRGRPRADHCGENRGHRRGRPPRASRSSKPIPRTMRRMAQRQSSRRPAPSLVGPPGPGCGRRQVSVLIATPGIDPTAREPGAAPRPEPAFESLRHNALRTETAAPAATPAPNTAFASSHTDPLNREPKATPRPEATFELLRRNALRPETAAPAATPAPNAAFTPSRIDPLNREPTAKPGSTVPFKPSRIDPLNREPGAFQDPEPPTRTLLPSTRSDPRTHAMHRTRGASAAGKKPLPPMNADERR